MEVFLFIIGYYVQLAASGLLFFKISKQRSIYGLSVDTQIAYLLAVISRCIWVMETRMVETYLAHFELVLSTLSAIGLCFLCFQYREYAKHAPFYLRIYITAPVAMLLAILFHPGDDWFSMQVLVSFTMYVEACGLLPQLFLCRKVHEVEPVTSHYVGLLVCARFIRMIFWIKMYLIGENFLQLLFGDILHTLLSADYLLLWCRKLRYGGRLIYSESLRV